MQSLLLISPHPQQPPLWLVERNIIWQNQIINFSIKFATVEGHPTDLITEKIPSKIKQTT